MRASQIKTYWPVIWTEVDDNLDFTQVLQRFNTFPGMWKIFLWHWLILNFEQTLALSFVYVWWADQGYSSLHRMLRQIRNPMNSQCARLFSKDWFLTQQVLSDCSKSLVEISFPFQVTCNNSKISINCLTYFYRLLSLSTELKSDCLITLLVSCWSQAEREDSVNDAWIIFCQKLLNNL